MAKTKEARQIESYNRYLQRYKDLQEQGYVMTGVLGRREYFSAIKSENLKRKNIGLDKLRNAPRDISMMQIKTTVKQGRHIANSFVDQVRRWGKEGRLKSLEDKFPELKKISGLNKKEMYDYIRHDHFAIERIVEIGDKELDMYKYTKRKRTDDGEIEYGVYVPYWITSP